jgi:hypothetical protein
VLWRVVCAIQISFAGEELNCLEGHTGRNGCTCQMRLDGQVLAVKRDCAVINHQFPKESMKSQNDNFEMLATSLTVGYWSLLLRHLGGFLSSRPVNLCHPLLANTNFFLRRASRALESRTLGLQVTCHRRNRQSCDSVGCGGLECSTKARRPLGNDMDRVLHARWASHCKRRG